MILGHGGARDLPDAIPVAQRHANVFLGIASLGASAILRLLEAVGPERIVFGSDWPFYPVATSLAKLLLATQDRPEAREPMLRGNALRILAFGDAGKRR
jgi:predicted TIM-barrel fold metal-dependent hydrolase